MGFVVNLKSDNSGLVDRTPNVDRLYQDIRKYPILTQQQETELFRQLRNGTLRERQKAKSMLVNCNQRFVIAVAKRFAKQDTLLDYVNEANIGLLKAIDTFDEERGIKFISHAVWHIRNEIYHYRATVANLVEKPNSTKTLHILASATNELTQEFERTPTAEELLDYINSKSKKKLKDKNDLIETRLTYVDEENSEEDDSSFGSIEEYNRVSSTKNTYEEDLLKDFNNEMIRKLFRVLNDKEIKIIKMRFGMATKEDGCYEREYDLAEIAKIYGVSAERVRQMVFNIMLKLKEEAKRESTSHV